MEKMRGLEISVYHKQWFNTDKTVQYLEDTKEGILYKGTFDRSGGHHGEWKQITE